MFGWKSTCQCVNIFLKILKGVRSHFLLHVCIFAADYCVKLFSRAFHFERNEKFDFRTA